MLYRKKHSPRYKKIRKRLIIFIVCVSLIVMIFENISDPYQRGLIESRAKVLAGEIINDSVTKILNEKKYTYEDFVNIFYTTDNQVKSITINSVNVNNFKSEVNTEITDTLEKNREVDYYVPLGAFTGITVISNYGPNILINFNLSGSINSKLVSTFETAGVNQTIHHIELVVEATVISMTPIVSLSPEPARQIKFDTNFEVAQTVIVGSVPNLYTGLKGLGLTNE